MREGGAARRSGAHSPQYRSRIWSSDAAKILAGPCVWGRSGAGSIGGGWGRRGGGRGAGRAAAGRRWGGGFWTRNGGNVHSKRQGAAGAVQWWVPRPAAGVAWRAARSRCDPRAKGRGGRAGAGRRTLLACAPAGCVRVRCRVNADRPRGGRAAAICWRAGAPAPRHDISASPRTCKASREGSSAARTLSMRRRGVIGAQRGADTLPPAIHARPRSLSILIAVGSHTVGHAAPWRSCWQGVTGALRALASCAWRVLVPCFAVHLCFRLHQHIKAYTPAEHKETSSLRAHIAQSPQQLPGLPARVLRPHLQGS